MSRMRTPSALVGLFLVLTTLVFAVIGPWLWAEEAARFDPAHLLEGHSAAHPLGTDDGGRDLLARTLAATRQSVWLAVLATLITTAAGVPLGALPSVLGPRAARFASGLIDSLVAFPVLLLAMFAALLAGAGARGAVVGIGVAAVPGLARLTRTLAETVASSDYVAAARVLGAGRAAVLVRHILPNIAEPLILTTTANLGYALLGLATLSLLGLGVQPPDYDWGRLLHDTLPRVYVDPETVAGPALAVAIAGTGFALLGESLARAAARTSGAASEAVLEVRDLAVAFGGVTPVRGVSFSVAPGELVGIVGESGSGKSLTALAVGGLVPYPGTVSGEVLLGGRPLKDLSRRELGTRLAMVFQDPMAALNPSLRVGSQLAEVATAHLGASRKEAWKRAVIAMGLMGEPALIVADEPTTALDVTVQKRVLDLLAEINGTTGTAGLLISHDLALVSRYCGRVLVMYAGRIVEELPSADLRRARHPYTRALVASSPDLSTDRSRPLAVIPGRQPAPAEVPGGCAFAPRCARALERCGTDRPALKGGLACWNPEDA